MSPRVLVVDDRVELREIVRLNLRARGYDVEEARSVDDALAAVERKRPDLVLLDIAMPGGDGWGLAERLQQDDDAVPVIVVSAQADEETARRARETGCAGYLTKPFTQADLTAAVEAAIAERAKEG